MAKFRYKGRGTVSFGDYYWTSQSVVDVPDNDTATLRKLRGSPSSPFVHPSFEEVTD